MKFIPHTRTGSLVLSGIHEISHKLKVPADLANTVQHDFSTHIEAAENQSWEGYKTENGKIALLFHEWIQALEDGDKTKAAQLENDIDQSVANHPFPYSETKQWYQYSTSKGYPHEATYDYALTNYRDCTGKGPDFGQITHTLSADAKVGIIGDWGTGTDDSFFLLSEMLDRAPDMEAILHLGDIYQCGTPFECAQNFLDPINRIFKEKNLPRIPIFTIPGNHEYYTGAEGYFQLIDVLNSDLDPAWKQEASFFCLRSEDKQWQFLGADTGLGCIEHQTEPGLLDSEAKWHLQRLQEFPGKSIMMTHHQFASADQVLNKNADAPLSYFNKRLLSQFGDHLDQIDLWIWGHDHWFLPYVNQLSIPTSSQKEHILKRGQLLGGSARETEESSRNASSILFKGSIQTDKEGQPIVPTDSTSGLTNHTYGIFDLKAAQVSYYEVGAWMEGDPPNKTAPATPLHIEDLA